jgi:D-alanyl-lipoteichoic acid acyltransferase DltB (MBOAT superfamily)
MNPLHFLVQEPSSPSGWSLVDYFWWLLDIFVYDKDHPMIFIRGYFWGFLAVVLTAYCFIYKKKGLRNAFLLVVSLFFYYKSSGAFFLLLVGTALMDYLVGLGIYHARHKALRIAMLTFSITTSLTLLGFFKYSYFIAENLTTLTGQPYHAVNWISVFFNTTFGSKLDIDKIILPVGISFFTFQTISYTVDVFRRRIKPVTNILDYGFFVSFFPQLVAGPIVRATDFIPQIYAPYSLTRDEFGAAIYQIMNGLVKKLFIADFISVNFIDRVYLNPGMYTGFEHLIAIFAYSLQVYCDFSGYTDIATGVARLLGFRLPKNFNSPYKAANVADFWRRWHISLSTWLKDYLYTPLGGNRKGSFVTWIFIGVIILFLVMLTSSTLFIPVMFGMFIILFLFMWVTYYHPGVRQNYTTNVNLLITMLVGGMWHNPGWMFIIWGGLNGVALMLHSTATRLADGKFGSNPWAKIWVVFTTVLFAGIMVLLLYLGGMDIRGIYILGVWALLSLITLGIYLIAGRPKAHGTAIFWAGKIWGILLTTSFISFTRIWFRSSSMETTTSIFDQLFDNFSPHLIPQVLWSYKYIFAVVILGYLIHWVPNRAKTYVVQKFSGAPLLIQAAICIVIVFGIFQVVSSDIKPFIYFQF